MTVVVRALAANYGKVTALAGVSLELGPGVTGLLGPNGAGKSTLLRILATAQAPTSGSVVAFGHDYALPSGRHQARAGLGYLPQKPGFYPWFRVREFVNHFALLKEIADRSCRAQAVDQALTHVGLQDRAHSRVRELSGGMQQRLALACATLNDPELIVLDEPTVGLDPEQRVRFRELIAGLGSNSTVILSTHQTDDIAAICAQVLVLSEGKVRFTGTPAELAERASDRVWITDVRHSNAAAGWATAEGRFRNIGVPPPGAEIVPATLDDGYLVVCGVAGTAT